MGQWGYAGAGFVYVNENVTNTLAGADIVLQGQLNRGLNLTGRVLSVKHENRNEIIDPLGLALGAAKTF